MIFTDNFLMFSATVCNTGYAFLQGTKDPRLGSELRISPQIQLNVQTSFLSAFMSMSNLSSIFFVVTTNSPPTHCSSRKYTMR